MRMHRVLLVSAMLVATGCTDGSKGVSPPTALRALLSGPEDPVVATITGPTDITQAGDYSYVLCTNGSDDNVYEFGIYTSSDGLIASGQRLLTSCLSASVSVVWSTPDFSVWGKIYNSLDQLYLTSNTLSVTVDVPPPFSVSISGVDADTAHKSVTMTANPSNGSSPYTYAWTINGSSACGNQSTCTGQLGDQGTYTSFAVTVIDATPDTASASKNVYAQWSDCQNCLRPAHGGSSQR